MAMLVVVLLCNNNALKLEHSTYRVGVILSTTSILYARETREAIVSSLNWQEYTALSKQSIQCGKYVSCVDFKLDYTI